MNLQEILVAALIVAQDELSAIADGDPDLVSDDVLEQISNALEQATKIPNT